MDCDDRGRIHDGRGRRRRLPWHRRSAVGRARRHWLVRVERTTPTSGAAVRSSPFSACRSSSSASGSSSSTSIGWLDPPSEHAVYNMVDRPCLLDLSRCWRGCMNRRGHVRSAAMVLLFTVSAGLVLFFLYTSPYRIEILFVVPVLMSAFVLSPWAAFAFAGVLGRSPSRCCNHGPSRGRASRLSPPGRSWLSSAWRSSPASSRRCSSGPSARCAALRTLWKRTSPHATRQRRRAARWRPSLSSLGSRPRRCSRSRPSGSSSSTATCAVTECNERLAAQLR